MEIDLVLLQKIKNSLRISHKALDEDLEDTISACLADLQMCGVCVLPVEDTSELDPLILNAVKLFCKKEYTDDPTKAARYKEGYDALKACLMLAERYREGSADE